MMMKRFLLITATAMLALSTSFMSKAELRNLQGTMSYQTLLANGTWENRSNPVTVTFGEVRNNGIYPITITGLYASQPNFTGHYFLGVYDAVHNMLAFNWGTSIGTSSEGHEIYWANVTDQGTIDPTNPIIGGLSADKKTLAIGGADFNAQYPMLGGFWQGSEGGQMMNRVNFVWKNCEIQLNKPVDFLYTSEEVDVYMDDNITSTDEQGNTFAFQLAFDASVYPDVIQDDEDGEYILNPATLKGEQKIGFTPDETTWFSQYGNQFNLSEFQDKPWYYTSTEASIHATDGYMRSVGGLCNNQSEVLITRTDPDGYFTNSQDITESWIGTVPGTNAAMYDNRDLTDSVLGYQGTSDTGLHFKDAFPHFATQRDNYTVDYVVYFRGKVVDLPNVDNQGTSLYQYIDANGASQNSSLIKIGNDWWYYAIPEAEHRYVAVSSMAYDPNSANIENPGNGAFTYKYPVGYHFSVVFPGDEPTGVTTVNSTKEIVSTRYTNLQGQVSATPWEGVNIVENTYVDGARKVYKMVK